MKEFLIKQISNYTKDASILEYVEELDENALKKILEKYKKLTNQAINQEVLDILINNYIIYTYFEYNKVFCTTLTFADEKLLNKLPEFTPEQMNDLIKECLKANSPYIAITVEEAINNYSIDDYIELIRICNRYDENDISDFIYHNGIIKCFTSRKYSLSYIAASLELLKNSKSTRNNLATIMKNENFNLIYSEFGKLHALNYFNERPDSESELFQDLITNQNAVLRFEVFDIIELFEKANKDNLQVLLASDALSFYEIPELIQIANNFDKIKKVALDNCLRELLSFEDIVTLYYGLELESEERATDFLNVVHSYRQYLTKENALTQITAIFDKQEYENAIREYIRAYQTTDVYDTLANNKGLKPIPLAKH